MTETTHNRTRVKAPRAQAKKLRTRRVLLQSAYDIMSEKGIDATTILEITERADVGFGTFYNYFTTKDEIAAQVLDCVIDTLARRNDLAATEWAQQDTTLIVANSMRAVGREMMQDKMWHWWFKRPDILIDRMREGFRPYAARDLEKNRDAGLDLVAESDSLWSMMIWLLTGRVIDIVDGTHSLESDTDMSAAILRLLGVDAETAHRLSRLPVPPLPPAEIDFSYRAPAT